LDQPDRPFKFMKQDNQKIKYAIYCRKSTDEGDRQVLSLSSQEAETERMFSALDSVKLPHESISAFEPYKRPVFADMIERIKKGEIQGIIAWHPDRLSRNPIDAAQIIYLLDTGKLKDLKFCSYYFDNSPEGKMMLQITLSQSKYSSDKLSKDVKRGIDKKAAMGWRSGLVPMGYLNSKIKLKGEQDILSDPERFPLVRQLFQYMLTGNHTVPQILKIANEELGLRMPATKKLPTRKLNMSTLYRAFTNPFYYGWYEWPIGSENWIHGNQEPMITEEEFDRIQFLLGRKGRPRSKSHKFAFTGLMRCGSCNATITAEEKFKKQKNGNSHHYIYYHCTRKVNPDCVEKAIALKDFNVQVDAILSKLTVSDRFQKWALKYLHEVRKEELVAREATIGQKQKEYERITNQIDGLLLKYTSPENEKEQIMTESEYTSLRSRLLKEKAALEADFNARGEEINDWVELSERTFNFARYARMWFAKGDLETKRAIFACLGSNLILKDQKLTLTLRKPFQFIFDGASEAEKELQRLEPLTISVKYMDLAFLRRKFPVMSG